MLINILNDFINERKRDHWTIAGDMQSLLKEKKLKKFTWFFLTPSIQQANSTLSTTRKIANHMISVLYGVPGSLFCCSSDCNYRAVSMLHAEFTHSSNKNPTIID